MLYRSLAVLYLLKLYSKSPITILNPCLHITTNVTNEIRGTTFLGNPYLYEEQHGLKRKEKMYVFV